MIFCFATDPNGSGNTDNSDINDTGEETLLRGNNAIESGSSRRISKGAVVSMSVVGGVVLVGAVGYVMMRRPSKGFSSV